MAVNIKKGGALTALSITPLIDVVFLLLIFFLVTSRFAQEERELDVTLPSASEAKPLTEQPKEVFVNIDKEGGFYVSGRYMTIDEVEQVLAQAKADNPVGQTVVIRADKNVPLEYAVQVMNVCNKVGITNYMLTTEGDST